MFISPLLSSLAVFAVGAAVELGIGKWGGEAWDSGAYWVTGLPLMFAAVFAGGIVSRQKPWLLGYAPFAGQIITMLAESGKRDFSLLPLGLILTTFMGLLGVPVAYLGVVLGKRFLGNPS